MRRTVQQIGIVGVLVVWASVVAGCGSAPRTEPPGRLAASGALSEPPKSRKRLYAPGVGDALGGMFLEPRVMARIRERDRAEDARVAKAP